MVGRRILDPSILVRIQVPQQRRVQMVIVLNYMAFSQKIISEVREKAAFRCCRCQSIGIEAHHIIPEEDEGPDIFENAAPLCPNCHTWFGANRTKQKEITEMRDWWYKRVVELYSPTNVNYQLLSDINDKIEALNTNQDKSLANLKETLLKVATETIDQMTAGTARITASGIANATVSPSTSLSPSVSASASPSPSFGGDGGSIFIISEKLTGSGNISANGGDGDIGGRGGKVRVETIENKFKGNISTNGGDSKKVN